MSVGAIFSTVRQTFSIPKIGTIAGCMVQEGKINRGARARLVRDGVVVWRCRNCGYLVEGQEAPEMCPACAHPQAYFELLGENW